MKLGVVALDGTKVAANAALATNRSHQAIEEEVQRMLAEAKAADAEEDAHYGPARRGDELPEGLGGRRERRKRVKEGKERLEREAEAAAKAVQEHVEQRRGGVWLGSRPVGHVRDIILDNLGLTGSIPKAFAGLERLRRLDLDGNDLAGGIPPELGDLSNLVYLYLILS